MLLKSLLLFSGWAGDQGDIIRCYYLKDTDSAHAHQQPFYVPEAHAANGVKRKRRSPCPKAQKGPKSRRAKTTPRSSVTPRVLTVHFITVEPMIRVKFPLG